MTRPLAEIEKEAILVAIIAHGGVVQAARALQIGKTTVYKRLEQYGIFDITVAELNRQLMACKTRGDGRV